MADGKLLGSFRSSSKHSQSSIVNGDAVELVDGAEDGTALTLGWVEGWVEGASLGASE